MYSCHFLNAKTILKMVAHTGEMNAMWVDVLHPRQ